MPNPVWPPGPHCQKKYMYGGDLGFEGHSVFISPFLRCMTVCRCRSLQQLSQTSKTNWNSPKHLHEVTSPTLLWNRDHEEVKLRENRSRCLLVYNSAAGSVSHRRWRLLVSSVARCLTSSSIDPKLGFSLTWTLLHDLDGIIWQGSEGLSPPDSTCLALSELLLFFIFYFFGNLMEFLFLDAQVLSLIAGCF